MSAIALFQSLVMALKISTHTQTLIPAKAFLTAGTSANAVSTVAIMVIIRKEGAAAPSAAKTAPILPFLFFPTKARVFTIRIPGRHCASA